ncbi:MAG: hypothetical protein K9M13_03285, partial [Simkaniaceae bacterium]|nr:hypothetical protein [Simkaniaceae bacterium]
MAAAALSLGSTSIAADSTSEELLEATKSLPVHQAARAVFAAYHTNGPTTSRDRFSAFFDQAIRSSLSDKLSSDLKEKHILICGEILNDGLGDYFQMRLTAEKISSLFPAVEISMIPQFEDPDSLDKDQETTPYEIIKLLSIDIAHRKIKEMETNPLINRAISIIHRANLIINLPYHRLCSLLKILKKEAHPLPPIIQFYELDFTSSLRSMGIRSGQAGIPIASLPSPFDLSSLAHRPLSTFLTTNPGETLFAYFHSQTLLCYFVFAQLMMHIPRGKNINMICPAQNGIDYLSEMHIGGLKQIEFYEMCETTETLVCRSQTIFSHSGVCLRLINPFPLPHRDVLTLIAASKSWVGCTGDVSFSEALAHGLPLYEMTPHKEVFVSSLYEYATKHRERFPLLSPFFRFMISLFSSRTSRFELRYALVLYELISDPRLQV